MGAFFGLFIAAVVLFWFTIMVDFAWQHRGPISIREALGAIISTIKGTDLE